MEKEKVALVACDGYEEEKTQRAVDECFELLGGLSSFGFEGKNVVVKANLLNNFKVETAATANPYVVLAVCRAVLLGGAKSVVVADSSGGLYNKAHMSSVYKVTGMTMIPERCAATLNDDFGMTEVDFDGVAARHFDVISAVANADLIVNLAKLKTHSLTFYTGAVKNLFGIIPGLQKVQVHGQNPELLKFINYFVDLNELLKDKIAVNFIDAVIGMEGAGPSAGSPISVNRIIASRSSYAADTVGMTLMDTTADDFPQTKVLKTRGLPFADLSEMEVVGEELSESVIKGYKRVPDDKAWHVDGAVPRPMGEFAMRIMTPHPYVKKSQCKGCEKCFNHCPPHAITMKNHVATFDYKKCIRCFCCQELCPYHLIKIKRSVFAKLIRRM